MNRVHTSAVSGTGGAFFCALLICASFPAAAGPVAQRPAAEAWMACPREGRMLACPVSAGVEAGPVAVVAGGGAACMAPALALGPEGLPSLAWRGEDGGIYFSAFDGRRWSPQELVSEGAGAHRGLPTLAAGDGGAAVAWAEEAGGGFEDIRYSVRTGRGWSVPRCAHEPNMVPDITPKAAAAPGGRFSVTWRQFDGVRYIERRAGGAAVVPERGGIPEGLFDAAVAAGAPPETALAWTGADGRARSVYLKELLDEREAAAAAGEAAAGTPAERAAAEEEIVILAFGDSITYGRDSSSNGPRTAYPVYLEYILEHNFPGRAFRTVNRGNPGETTSWGLDRIDLSIDDSHPHAVLIMEGTNDMFFGVGFGTVQLNLKQMALKAAARGVLPVLATVPPPHPATRASQYARTRAFYSGGYVQAVCNKYLIPCADQWNAFVTVPNFSSVLIKAVPGVHPNDNGYRYVMAPEWFESLIPYAEIYFGAPFVPVGPHIDLAENAPYGARGSSESFSYSLIPSNDFVRDVVDCYVALRTPEDQLLFFDARGQATSRTTPLARTVILDDLPAAGDLLTWAIPPGAPLGVYTLYVQTVRTLRSAWDRDAWTSNLAEITFEVNQ